MPGLFGIWKKDEPLLQLTPEEKAKQQEIKAAQEALAILKSHQRKKWCAITSYVVVASAGVVSLALGIYASVTGEDATQEAYRNSPCGEKYPGSFCQDGSKSLTPYCFCKSGQDLASISGKNCSDEIAKAGCKSPLEVPGIAGGVTAISLGGLGLTMAYEKSKKNISEKLGTKNYLKLTGLAGDCGVSNEFLQAKTFDQMKEIFERRIAVLKGEDPAVRFHV